MVLLLTLERKGNILMTDFKLFSESPCFCILRQMICTMHFEISFLLCYKYANQRMHWSKEMYIACNFKSPQSPLECEFCQFVYTEISKLYGQYFKSMLKFQMHVRVKYSVLTLSVRIATSQGYYFRDSTCRMLRYA